MNVFQAFPQAIEAWKIGRMKYSTITGNTTEGWRTIYVIADRGDNSSENRSPNAAGIASDTLLYIKPTDAPTLNTGALMASYAIKDSYGATYSIVDAAIAKNQHTGHVEHIELKLKQTGAEYGDC